MFRGVGILSVVLVLLSSESARSAEQKLTLSITPAGVGKPILKYRLLPDPRELRPGNAATIYYRTEAMFVENSALLADLRDAKWSEWNDMALNELPLDEMDRGVQMARHFLRELEVAATCRDCDWQLDEREEGIALLLPEVQGFRMFGSLLGAGARLHIARKNYPEALRMLRIGYTLGHHLGKGPTLIHCLVGIAIVSVMDRQLETLIQQPDAPNLYWSFRTLPRPLFDPRSILLKESEWVERSWPLLKRLDKGVLTAREIQAGVAEIDKRIAEFNVVQVPYKNATRSVAIVALHAPARAWLLENGFDRDMVQEMNPIQAVLLSHYKQFRLAYEEWLVWAVAGEDERYPAMKAARERANTAMGVLNRLFFANLLDALSDGGIVPTVARINETSLRVERRHVGLATIEALRAQAAENGGKWPTSLEEVKVLPVPVDPITRKPWDFKREGDWVTLTSPLADGEKPTSTSHFIYRVELRGK